ncbi:MAG: UDP-3-O-(3-hydroxymyristoyl)glucosamine N-acyltransferase [Anaerovoracaceae bacterium]
MKSSEIASFLKKELVGNDICITSFSTISSPLSNTVVFANKFSIDFLQKLARNDILAIIPPTYTNECELECSYVISDHPRLDYLRIINKYFYPKVKHQIHPTSVIEDGAKLGENVNIGAHCYIGAEVSIGNNTFIAPNVIIDGKTFIGTECYIKSGSVIGQTGFGFERNSEGIPEYFPHLGVIKIGNCVHIGANNTIDRATLGETIIEDYVKTDNLVHIAHNDVIRKASLITAGVIFSGGVELGAYSWMAPNSCVKEKVKLGQNSFVGLGGVVIKNVEENTIVIGNPAKKLIK